MSADPAEGDSGEDTAWLAEAPGIRAAQVRAAGVVAGIGAVVLGGGGAIGAAILTGSDGFAAACWALAAVSVAVGLVLVVRHSAGPPDATVDDPGRAFLREHRVLGRGALLAMLLGVGLFAAGAASQGSTSGDGVGPDQICLGSFCGNGPAGPSNTPSP